MPRSRTSLDRLRSSGCATNGKLLGRPVDKDFRFILDSLRGEDSMTDVVVISEDNTKFPAHKLVLMAASRYFRDLFMNCKVTPFNTVSMIGAESSVVGDLIKFCYTGEVKMSRYSTIKIKKFMSAGAALQMDHFCECCLEELSSNICESNYIEMMCLAKDLKLQNLEEYIIHFAIRNLTLLMSRDDFGSLSPSAIYRLVQMTAGQSQELALRAATAWTKYDTPIRRNHFRNMTKLFNHSYSQLNLVETIADDETSHTDDPQTIPLDSKAGLQKKKSISPSSHSVKSLPPILQESPPESPSSSCHSAPQTTTPYELLERSKKMRCKVKETLKVSPRFKQPALLFVGRDDNNRSAFIFYFMFSDRWSHMEELHMCLEFQQGIGSTNTAIYIIGGVDSRQGGKTASCFVRHLQKRSTTRLPDLHLARSHPMVILRNDIVYAIAGSGRCCGRGMSHIERLRSNGTSWDVVHPLREKRDETVGMCTINDDVIIVGGGTTKCEGYSLKKESCRWLPSLPQHLHDQTVRVAALSGRVCAFKEFSPNKLYFMRPEGDEPWKCRITKNDYPECIKFVVGYGTRMFAVDIKNFLYQYDILDNRWSVVTRLPKELIKIKHMNFVHIDTPEEKE